VGTAINCVVRACVATVYRLSRSMGGANDISPNSRRDAAQKLPGLESGLCPTGVINGVPEVQICLGTTNRVSEGVPKMQDAVRPCVSGDDIYRIIPILFGSVLMTVGGVVSSAAIALFGGLISLFGFFGPDFVFVRRGQ
jgi:hypothetical protein